MSGSDQLRTYRRAESVVFLKTDEPFGGLSNMAGGYPIHVNGVRILTSEALYQVCRFPHLPDVQRMIIGQISPMTAKMRSKPYRKDSRLDWDQVRVRIMRWCLRMKLANNWHTFSELLLRTGDRPIVEESRKDDFWGAKAIGGGSALIGMNVLGRLLMELREQVKQQGREATLDVAPPQIPQFLLLGRPIEVVPGSVPSQEVADHDQGSLFGADAVVSAEASTSVTKAPRCERGAYEAYRPARMRWLPPIPEHWNEQRAKTFFREVDERSKTGKEELLSVSHLTGVTPRSQKNVTMFKAASYVGSKLCQPGDIVINTLWAWMAALGASCHRGIVSPAYGVYRPHSADSFNPAYLDYLLRTRAYVAEYIGRSTGIRSSRLRLYPNQFLDIPLIQPPRPEQEQIVTFLRTQDAHIARFIKAKRELVKLLIEQKLRIIDHAVTRGLDAAVALKPSSIEWLGEVPEHWEVKPLKRWVRLNASTLSEKTDPDFEFRYVDIGSVQTGRLAKELERIRFEAAPSRARRVLRRGDTIISTVRTYLKAIWYVCEDADDLIASTGFAVLTPGNRVEPEYLGYVIQSSAFVNRVAANSIGIAYPAIAETVLGRFPVALPPTVEEQQAIVAHIKTESTPLDDAITRTEDEIKLIREYRDRLIADVVTGQVDVRGWQPGPEDVVDDAALAALGDENEDVTEEEDGDGED
jgi:type I restriction enzyme S subunit